MNLQSWCKNNKVLVPVALTTFRLLLGPFSLWWACTGGARLLFLPILISGLLSDIYDGVAARKLGVSTPFIRRYDSLTDVIYYLFLAGVAWNLEHNLIMGALPWVLALIVSEVAGIGLSLWRFGCLPATHSWMAKFYGLALFVTFAFILSTGGPAWLLMALGIIGVATNLEIILILFLAKSAPVDVLCLGHLRRREAEGFASLKKS